MYGHAENPTLLAYVSDWITALCYYAIPAQLLYFLAYFPYKIPIRYRFAIVLAGAFIGLCGSSHLCMTLLQDGQLTNQWVLDYMKLATAIVSAVMASFLLKLIPDGLRFVNYSLDLEQAMKRKLIELDEAHRTVRQANMNKGLFISTLSHELRNPLHIITANADFLFETHLNEEQRDYVKSVTDSATLMTSIVNDVLDMSRLQAGRMSFERIPVDLNAVAMQCIKNMRHTAKAKRIDLTMQFNSLHQYVISDPTRLHQLMLNLLTNALKFTASGKSVNLSICHLDTWPVCATTPAPLRILASRRASARDDDDLTDATLRLLRTSSSTAIDASPSTDDAELLESSHAILPSLSKNEEFTFAARSICLDFTQTPPDHVDETDPDGKHSNEHKYIHSTEEDQYSDGVCETPTSATTSRSQRRSSSIFAITVTDTGVGISAHALSQLFHAYTQAKLSHVREFGGTGLGLSICSEIVKSLRGCIIVTSELGKGSEFTFIIRLPLSDAQELRHLDEMSFRPEIEMSPSITEPPSPPKTSPSSTQALSPAQHLSSIKSAPAACDLQFIIPVHTILVTDDNEINRKILSRILVSMKYNVVTANDGLEAVEAFQNAKEPFLCAFLDISMPRMDGYEACRQIRAAGHTTPIIALTANALIEEKMKSVEAGMNQFLTKPLRKVDVAKVLYRIEREATQLSHVRQPSPTRPPPIDASSPLFTPRHRVLMQPIQNSPSLADTDSAITSSVSSAIMQVETDSPFRGTSSGFLSHANSPPVSHHTININNEH